MSDIFDNYEVIEEIKPVDVSRLPDIYSTFTDMTPDQGIAARRLSESLNIDFTSAARDIKTYEDVEKKNSIMKAVTELNGKGELKYPKLINYLNDPVNAKITRDYIPELIEFDKAVSERSKPSFTENLIPTLQYAFDNFNAQLSRSPGTLLDMANIIPNLGNVFFNTVLGGPETPQRKVPDAVINNPLAKFYDRKAELEKPDILNKSLIDSAVEGSPADIASNLALQVLSNAPTQILLGVATFMGAGPAALGGMGLLSAADAQKEGIEAGKTPLQTQTHALLSGIAEGFFERYGSYSAFKKFAETTVKTAGRQGLVDFVKKGIKAGFNAFGQEAQEEFATSIAQDVSDYVTGNEDALKGLIPRAVESGVVGGFSGFGLTSPMGIVNMAVRQHVYAKDRRFWDRINETAQQSKLREKAPEILEEAVKEINTTPDTPDNIYFSMDKVEEFFQNDEEGLTKFIEDNNLQDQVIEAKATGADISIPVEKMAAKYSGTDLSLFLNDYIRLRPDGITPYEERELASDLKTLMSDVQEEVARRAAENVLPIQIKTIREQLMLDRSKGGFGLTAEDANAQTAVFIAGATQLSRQRGETLQAWFDRVSPKLNIGAEVIELDRTEVPEADIGTEVPGVDIGTEVPEVGIAAEVPEADIGTEVPGVDIGTEVPEVDVFKQEAQKPRGAVQFNAQETVISLFKTANRSTFLHEIGHIFMRDMQQIVESGAGDEQLSADYKTLVDFVGGDISSREAQEKLARGFEAYLREGKAPSVKLLKAFRKFKAWLTGIYKSVRGLNVEVSDELRGVFDRLLASEQEINQAKELYKQTGRLLDIIGAEEEAKNKAAVILNNTDDRAKEKMTKVYMNAFLKSGGTAQIKAQAKEELFEDRVYQALEEPALNAAEIKQRFGEAGYKALKSVNPRIVTAKGENTLEHIALVYGFDSPEDAAFEMSRAVKKSEKLRLIENRLRSEIENKILEETMVTPEDSIHNEDSIEYLIIEAVELSKKSEGRKYKRQNVNVYKEAAERAVGQKSVDAASRYEIYAKTEQRYAELALKEAKKGNYEASLAAKEKQLLNHAMVQAAVKARDLKLKIEKRYATSRINKSVKDIEDEYREAALNYINHYGLNKGVTSRTQEAIPDIEALDEGLAAAIPQWVLERRLPEMKEGDIPYRKLSMDDLIQLDESIRAVMHYGRDELKSMKDSKYQTIESVVKEAVENMLQLKDKKIPGEFSKKKGLISIKDSLMSLTTMPEFTFERADNYSFTKKHVFGIMRQIFNQGVKSETEYERMKDEVYQASKPYFETLSKAKNRIEKQYGGVSFDLPGIPRTAEATRRGQKWTVERLISVMLNTGNIHNRSVLMMGHEITLAQLDSIFAMFTAEEIQAVQGLWDSIDLLKKPLFDTHFDLYNIRLNEVEAEEQTVVSSEGKKVTLRGGYYPVMLDSTLSDKAGRFAEEKDIMQSRKNAVYRKVKPSDSQTKERKFGHSIPISLSLGGFLTHVSDTARYISHAPYLTDLNRILNNDDWRQIFKEKFGDENYKMLKEWAAYQANPERKLVSKFDKYADTAKRMATAAILPLNFTVGLKQRLSLFSAIKELGMKEILEAYKQTDFRSSVFGLTNNDFWQNIINTDPYMKARAGNISREINDVMKNIKSFKKGFNLGGRQIFKKDIKEWMFEWIQMNDRATVGVVWTAAYNKALKEGLRRGLTEEANHKEAVTYAGRIVATTQPSALPIDFSALQRSEGAVRLFTAFMTWALKFGNRLSGNYRAWKDGAISTKEYARHVAYEVLLAPIGALGLVAAATGELPEWWELLTAPFEAMISWIPIVRDIPGAYKYRKPIGLPIGAEVLTRGKDAGSAAVKFAKDINSESGTKRDRAVSNLAWKLGSFGEILVGVPAVKLARNIVKQIDRVDSETAPKTRRRKEQLP